MTTLEDAAATLRAELEQKYGTVWTTDEATKEFEFVAFGAPYVEVVRKSTGERGLLQFTHRPRFYFDFTVSR